MITLRRRLVHRLLTWACARDPDVIIGGADDPYLFRWHLIPRNRVFNAYVHLFLRSDDDRALHDHPWCNCSILLLGSYVEHRIRAGGINIRTQRMEGTWTVRALGTIAHRIELTDGSCWTLFLTGPVYRHWGFHCPDKGWVPWQEFTSAKDPGQIGPGCA